MRRQAKEAARYLVSLFAPEYLRRRHALPMLDEVRRTGVLFIHIPKSAGFAVSEAIYGQQIAHLTWRRYYAADPRSYARLLKFAVYRDPVARFVSAFHFLRAGGINPVDRRFGESLLSGFASPSDFACALRDPEMRARAMIGRPHFRPAASFVCDAQGRVRVDHLIDIARLDIDLPAILPAFAGRAIEERNIGPRQGRREALSDEAVVALRAIYADDFRLGALALGPERVYLRGLGEPARA